MTETIATYTLRLRAPDGTEKVPAGFGGALSEAEENLSDLLPEGFYVRIDAWDAPPEDEEEL